MAVNQKDVTVEDDTPEQLPHILLFTTQLTEVGGELVALFLVTGVNGKRFLSCIALVSDSIQRKSLKSQISLVPIWN